MATLPDVVEPLHQCSSRCRFELDSRRCLTSGNVHRCSRTCVIVDAEGHYVCTLLGLVLRDFMLPASPPRTQRRRNTVKVKSHKPWIREAAEIFLATDRTDLILSARRRATAKIRKQLGLVTPSLRGSMSAFQKILGNLSAQRSMNFPLPVHLCEPVLDELCLAFGEFWERVGHQAFSLTKQSVYTYTAVMIENLAEGVKDSHGSIIIPRSEVRFLNNLLFQTECDAFYEWCYTLCKSINANLLNCSADHPITLPQHRGLR